ncbi:MAG: hypothetical protein ACMUIS_08590 [bacterium]
MHVRMWVACLLILPCLLLVVPSRVPAQMIPEEALRLKEEGDRAIMRGAMEEAVSFYEQALRIYPDLPDVLYFLGLTYDLDFQDLVNAIYYYRRYLEIAPQGPQSAEVAGLLRKAERRLEERKRQLGLVEEPPAPAQGRREQPPPAQATAPSPTPVKPPGPSPQRDGDVITIQMQESILKYDLKLRVWEREGFVDRFNELARKRSSPLEEDIAGQRESLRMERKLVTDFINYQEEAIDILLKRAVLRGIVSLGVELNHLPGDLDPAASIRSYDILEMKENDRFVTISAEVSLDLNALARDLAREGYVFEPKRITIIMQNVQGDLATRLTEHIIEHSDYAGPSSGGLYPIYTTLETFAREIRGMRIGTYRFNPILIGQNSITLQVLNEG